MRLGCFGMVAVAVLIGLAVKVFPQADEGAAAKPGTLAVVGLSVAAADPDDSWGRSYIPMYPPGDPRPEDGGLRAGEPRG
ncbi:MAG: hypothetical protein MUE73_16535 [Planctomycetes bacterium]|nr:hypothetical protein [Planctomycetota bacterium]